ncbi:amphi-Trp domain-containing protein [Natronococcus sp.]|uniref:amphi-Trp domain-containing protein n=1 Tax=Natronococcus sp. TaxID=35747 RepID=UPI003A4E4D35
MGETLFELEHAYDRDELAAIFREFAVALEGETPVELHSGEYRLTVDVPADVVAELEGEREDGRTELEFELEWDDPDGTGIRVTDAEAGDETADAETTAVEENATGEEVRDRVETSESPGRRSRFEVYQDRAEEWRWRLVHWNGNIIADSGEGYASRSNAERAARGVMRNAPNARIERREG